MFSDKFYTLKKLSSWEEANKSCTLATPSINYSRYVLSLDFGENFEGDVGEYWVGYTTHNLIFQYIGMQYSFNRVKRNIRK